MVYCSCLSSNFWICKCVCVNKQASIYSLESNRATFGWNRQQRRRQWRPLRRHICIFSIKNNNQYWSHIKTRLNIQNIKANMPLARAHTLWLLKLERNCWWFFFTYWNPPSWKITSSGHSFGFQTNINIIRYDTFFVKCKFRKELKKNMYLNPSYMYRNSAKNSQTVSDDFNNHLLCSETVHGFSRGKKINKKKIQIKSVSLA